MGPFWLTGGGYGLDGSWIASIVLLIAFPVVYRLTRDLYLPPGEMGYWQGAIRDPGSPEFAVATAAIRGRQDMTIELLYTDYLGHQRTISRFILMPVSEGRWFVGLTRHWNLDRPDPRPQPDGPAPPPAGR